MLQRQPITGCTPRRPGGSSSAKGWRTSCQLGSPLRCGHRTGGRRSSMQSNAIWRNGQGGGFRLDNGAMKLLGFQIPNYTFPGVTNDKLFEHVVMLATTAEKAGFDSVWVMDHFYQLPNSGPRTDPMLEGYATLAAIAARTRKVRLGTLV